MGELTFRNRAGKEISEARWRHLLRNPKYAAIAKARVYPPGLSSPWEPHVWVSTIWNGIDLTSLGGETQVFTTTVFDMPSEIAIRTWRADTQSLAEASHGEAVAWASEYLAALGGARG